MKKKNDAQEYYNISAIDSCNADYNIIFGERSNGKSYAVKEKAIKAAIADENAKFIYLRRYQADISNALTNLYLADMPIDKYTNGEQDIIYTSAGKIYIAKSGEKRSNIRCIGYCRSLSDAQRYSSGSYLDVQIIILEEFIAINGDYLPNEILKFRHFISTVARKRDIKIYMIGNAISRLCPYWREFGIKNIDKQQIGTIDVYSLKTDAGDIRIACEYCGNSSTQSRIAFGRDSEMTNEGKWLTRDYPHISEDMLTISDLIYSFVVEWYEKRFLCRIYVDPVGGAFVYVVPKTTPVKEYTLTYSNIVSNNPYYKRGLIVRTKQDKLIINLLSDKAFFCDNLTGTEFNDVILKLKLLYSS